MCELQSFHCIPLSITVTVLGEHKKIMKVMSYKRCWEENPAKLFRSTNGILKVRIRFEGKARVGEKSGAYTLVCEHFLTARNTAIGP